jgi:hypothetical protein
MDKETHPLVPLEQPKACVYSVGAVAELLGVQAWQVRRVIKRGLHPEVRRFGHEWRYFTQDELPAVRQALIRGGYLPPDPPAAEANGNGRK